MGGVLKALLFLSITAVFLSSCAVSPPSVKVEITASPTTVQTYQDVEITVKTDEVIDNCSLMIYTYKSSDEINCADFEGEMEFEYTPKLPGWYSATIRGTVEGYPVEIHFKDIFKAN